MPKAIVIRTAGTNCEQELVRAFALAGAQPQVIHLDQLIKDPAKLDEFDLIGFPGGFSYGDDIASGRIFAMKARQSLYPALRAAIDRAVPMIGICNGFQVLVQLGLLPGPDDQWPADEPPPQQISLTNNAGARFVDTWVRVNPVPESTCIWTRGLETSFTPDEHNDVLLLPVANGEGRFLAASPQVLEDLNARNQIALRYADNFNGSDDSIAGICDASGLIFGLMPHPERFLEWTRHPYWTRLPETTKEKQPPGLTMFKNAVEAAARIPV